MLERMQDPAVKQRLMENTERSVARGTFGSPTFFVGEEIWFGKDRLRDVEEAISIPVHLSRFAGEVKTRSVEGEGRNARRSVRYAPHPWSLAHSTSPA